MILLYSNKSKAVNYDTGMCKIIYRIFTPFLLHLEHYICCQGAVTSNMYIYSYVYIYTYAYV